jgi:hypothetical protein
MGQVNTSPAYSTTNLPTPVDAIAAEAHCLTKIFPLFVSKTATLTLLQGTETRNRVIK